MRKRLLKNIVAGTSIFALLSTLLPAGINTGNRAEAAANEDAFMSDAFTYGELPASAVVETTRKSCTGNEWKASYD